MAPKVGQQPPSVSQKSLPKVAVAVATEATGAVADATAGVPGVGDMFQVMADAVSGKLATSINRNVSDGALDSATGRIPDSAWADPTQLVGRMTQNQGAGGGASGANAASRCGPTNLLAGALLQGPAEGARYLTTVAKHAGDRLSDADKKKLTDIAARLKNHTATFDDLSAAQGLLLQASKVRQHLGDFLKNPSVSQEDKDQIGELMQRFPNLRQADLDKMSRILGTAIDDTVQVKLVEDPRDPSKKEVDVYTPGQSDYGQADGLDDGELRDAAKKGGLGSHAIGFDASSKDPVGDVLSKLRPGESAVIRVASKDGETDPGHFVTVGRMKDGRAFIYNPDPSKGDSTLTVGNAGTPLGRDFADEVAKYSRRAHTDSDGKNPGATKITY